MSLNVRCLEIERLRDVHDTYTSIYQDPDLYALVSLT
jgi:hypothetical protein